VKLANHLKDGFPSSMVQIACRFVRQEQFGLANQRSGDRNSLLFAAGQLTNFVVQSVAESDAIQHPPRCRCRFFLVFSPNQLGHHRILQGRELGQKMMELKDKADMLISEPR